MKGLWSLMGIHRALQRSFSWFSTGDTSHPQVLSQERGRVGGPIHSSEDLPRRKGTGTSRRPGGVPVLVPAQSADWLPQRLAASTHRPASPPVKKPTPVSNLKPCVCPQLRAAPPSPLIVFLSLLPAQFRGPSSPLK